MQSVLGGFRRRTLDKVASLVAGRATRVVLTRRLPMAAVVVAESNTLLLRDDRCGLYDLALCASLLEHRGEVAGWAQRDEGARASRLRQWVRERRESLPRRFPGVGRHDGVLRLSGSEDEVAMVWRDVPFTEPIRVRDLRLIECGAGPSSPEAEAEILRRAIADGSLALEERSDLREMPVANLPLDLPAGANGADELGRLEMELKRCRPHAERFLACYEAGHEWIDELRGAREASSHGAVLDGSRLAESVALARAGRAPRPFRRRGSRARRGHRPSGHLVVLGVDLAGLRGGDLSRPALSRRFLLSMMLAFTMLDTELVMVGFHDRVSGVGASPVYLHSPVLLKALDEPMGAPVWARIDRALSLSSAPAGTAPRRPAAFAPLHLERLVEEVRRARGHRQLGHDHVAYFGERGLGEDQRSDFWSRAASSTERIVRRYEAEFDQTWDGVEVIPRELKAAAAPGDRVAAMGTL